MISAQLKASLDQYFAEKIRDFLGDNGILVSLDPDTGKITFTLDSSGDWTGTLNGLTLTQILASAEATATALDAVITAWVDANFFELTGDTVSGASTFQSTVGIDGLATLASLLATTSEFNGSMTFSGSGRVDWTKIAADTITLSNGTSADAVADLQTANDGNIYHVNEVVGVPGMLLVVDFVSVTAFNWIDIRAGYDGGAGHSVSIDLYNWDTTSWDGYNCLSNFFTSTGTVLKNSSFFIPDDSDYIGTGGNDGEVRVRFNHPVTGVGIHDMYIDVVALYQ